MHGDPIRSALLALALALGPAIPLQAGRLEGKVKTHVLKNGMTFLLLERKVSPTLGFYMRFKVGSVDEHAGIGGTAHLLEHMLFKGTHTLGTKDWEAEKVVLAKIDSAGEELDRLKLTGGDAAKIKQLEEDLKKLQDEAKPFVVKDEIDEIYSINGGVGFNATTDQDLTSYMISLPKNRFELWSRIESDRMLHPVLREYYSERDVIEEERRMRVDADPEGTLFEQFQATAFQAHNYHNPTIGWMSEIERLSKQKVEEFRRVYYAPNNVVCAIVGDFDTPVVIELLERYFGPIPSQDLPRPPTVIEPDQLGERRIIVKQDSNPLYLVGFHKPCLPDRADYVFDVINTLLSSGRSSRLYKRLVKEERIAAATDTFSSFPGTRYPNSFGAMAVPMGADKIDACEKSILAELDRLKTELVPAQEFEKVVNKLEAGFLRSLDSNSGLAENLSYFQAVAGDWRYIDQHSEVIRTIKPEEIQEAAKKYFTDKNRTVAIMLKEEAPAAATSSTAATTTTTPGGGAQ